MTHMWLSVMQKELAMRRMRGPLKATAHKVQHKPQCKSTSFSRKPHRFRHHFNQHRIKGDVPYCHWCPVGNVCVWVPFLEMSSSTSCMKLATSGGSLWISLSLRPSFRRFSSLKKGCKDRRYRVYKSQFSLLLYQKFLSTLKPIERSEISTSEFRC